MQTAVKELANSRVEVEVEVPAPEVEKATSRAARAMAKEMRMPGFRAGKAPASLVIQRLGFGPVLQEAIREALPDWYEQALFDAGVVAIGDPSIDMVSSPEREGEPLKFKFEVGVRPAAKLGEYKGLEVGKEEKEVPDEIVDTEVERIREGFARLEPVEREAAEGDSLLIDFEGFKDGSAFQGGAAEDYLLALGSGQLIEGFEEQLVGSKPGEEREVKVTFPDDYQAEHLAGEDAVFKVKVKEVREKILPELDDDFASDASEFDTLEELRADIREKVGAALGSRAEEDFRVAAIDAAVAAAEVEVPDELATARATERWERMERQLAGRGMDPNAFLQMQGKSREELIEESKPDAELELRRESVVTAIAEAEGIEVSEEEMVEALAHSAEHERTSPEKLLERLRKSGRDAMIREDIRARKAVELVAESAKPIPKEQAEAREKIWTPEEEQEEKGELWTPGDPED
ncbi:MAG TPA: trigger factor [Solirubrobacterales bacterium]|nr:trigger factor [Solirubrobacterales bacterium]